MIHRLTDWLLALFIRGDHDPADPATRAKYGALEGWVSIATKLEKVNITTTHWTNTTILELLLLNCPSSA